MKLKCPICNKQLFKSKLESYQCENNHSFDISKSKYINLLISNKKSHGDNKTLVKNRIDFLELGFYDNLANYLSEQITLLNISNLIDFACGTGYYTNFFRSNNPNTEIIGVDISKNAIQYASKKYKNIQFIIASTFNPPFYDNSVDCITNIFAPFDINIIRDLLKDKGYFINVSPNTMHLYELKQVIYDNVYLNEPKQIIDSNFKNILTHNLTYKVKMSNDELLKLFFMTPYSYKTKPSDIKKIQQIENLSITLDFNIQILQKI